MFRFLLALLIATPALADEQAWLAGIATGPVKGKLVTWLEVQPRVSQPADTLILRPAIGVQIDPATQLLLGYAYIETRPEGRAARREHRVWQQALVRLAGTPGKAVLMSRTRLEQRRAEGFDDTGWRLRQFLRGQVWLDERWSIIGISEAFVGLNRTDWGQPARLDQVRNFVGVGVPLSSRLTLEAGYLNQHIIRDGADANNHVMNVNLFFRLG